ncbi:MULTISPECIES: hypothetical protein [unclassified Sphingomonas]|uniref:hypothetical protein n=1 Tax=unclassified Sphingomonas TaxID=196159 RepID=UPI0018CEC118|nr:MULTISPECIES: hypothetical protein [unclassified Sphingomonas]
MAKISGRNRHPASASKSPDRSIAMLPNSQVGPNASAKAIASAVVLLHGNRMTSASLLQKG